MTKTEPAITTRRTTSNRYINICVRITLELRVVVVILFHTFYHVETANRGSRPLALCGAKAKEFRAVIICTYIHTFIHTVPNYPYRSIESFKFLNNSTFCTIGESTETTGKMDERMYERSVDRCNSDGKSYKKQ